MALSDIAKLAADGAFSARVQAQLVASAIAIYNEAANEVQSLSISGTATSGSFTLASLPGSTVINQTGTLANAANTITGLSSTVGLWVGMSVTGTNVAANATLASITGLTTATLSANSSAAGAQALTFSGTPNASIPWNAGAVDVQAILQALSAIGNDDIVCAGGPLPGTPVSITFCGAFGANPQRLITIGTNSLVGVAPVPSVARTTAGTVGQINHVRRAAKASAILNDPSRFTALMVWGIAADPAVQSAFTGGGSVQLAVSDANIAGAASGMWNAYL